MPAGISTFYKNLFTTGEICISQKFFLVEVVTTTVENEENCEIHERHFTRSPQKKYSSMLQLNRR